jgi:hypothetical protein
MATENIKTKTIKGIEEKMEALDANSLRYHILESARSFKTSWIKLGRSLYTAWRDKCFKEWGYASFDIYTSRELGIRKNTAMKLLRSYYFLEKEEPGYLKHDYSKESNAATLPSYESIDVLRLAKNKKELDEQDYDSLKKDIFEKGKDARQIKKDLTALIRQRQELDPQEALAKRRTAVVRRFLGTLKSLKNELETAKLVPYSLIKEAGDLIKKLEAELSIT